MVHNDGVSDTLQILTGVGGSFALSVMQPSPTVVTKALKESHDSDNTISMIYL